jgi:mono/diheme cytochrome c family protein
MQSVRTAAITLVVAIAIIGCLISGPRSIKAQQPNKQKEIERGRYLVEEVAKCGECHTPRNSKGEVDREAWLQGAPIWIEPVHPIQNWADRAPAIAGLPGMSVAEAERVLEKGIGPEGETLRPPMHIYHMNPADADAIIAYLNSLPRPSR